MKYYKKMVGEITQKYNYRNEFPAAKITCSRDCKDFILNKFPVDIAIQESFMVIYLNNSNNTIAFTCLSIGGMTGTIVDVRIVIKQALDVGAVSIVLAHNHPSGQLKPSQADKNITNKIKEACKFMDIKVLDHIIVTPQDAGYFSFADEGIL